MVNDWVFNFPLLFVDADTITNSDLLPLLPTSCDHDAIPPPYTTHVTVLYDELREQKQGYDHTAAFRNSVFLLHAVLSANVG